MANRALARKSLTVLDPGRSGRRRSQAPARMSKHVTHCRLAARGSPCKHSSYSGYVASARSRIAPVSLLRSAGSITNGGMM